ncbi:MAG TPA: hypothetical protein VLH79_11685, partial [Chthonomonadales bacterium]|nr:hypothetical protein [Chthonomonadales bacterium]
MHACQSAVVLLAAACLGPAALAQGLPRAPLASDSAISVRVGMAATWQSMANPAPPDITGEKAADLSEYALTATPTIDNLKDHALALAPLPENPAWYVFRPAGDTYHLTFDIADSAQRLGHIVVSDLATGQVVGSVRAAPGGATLAGQIEVAWEQAYFRIDGHAASGALLFVLGATNRRPDTFVHFSTVGQFAPHRPATVSTPRFPGGCDVVVGVVGDPYNPVGVRVTTAGGDSWFSLGCGARDRTNPTPAPDIMEPPLPFHPYIRRKCIQQPGAMPFPPNERADLPSLANAILSARQEDTTRAITAIAMPPYSDMTGHWHAKFLGRVTAFFAVPYTVAR